MRDVEAPVDTPSSRAICAAVFRLKVSGAASGMLLVSVLRSAGGVVSCVIACASVVSTGGCSVFLSRGQAASTRHAPSASEGSAMWRNDAKRTGMVVLRIRGRAGETSDVARADLRPGTAEDYEHPAGRVTGTLLRSGRVNRRHRARPGSFGPARTGPGARRVARARRGSPRASHVRRRAGAVDP